MEFLQTIGGGAPYIKKYIAGTAITTRGIPLLGNVDGATDVADVEPVTPSDPTVEGSQVGLCLDITGSTATFTSQQQATSTLQVNVIINPDAVYRCKLSGGSTSDTALSIQTTTASSADGLLASGATSIDNGTIWGYSGANSGEYRVTDDASGSVFLPFPSDIASGDTFLYSASRIFSAEVTNPEFFDLTTALDQLDATTAETTNNNFVVIDHELRDASDSGTTNSFYHLIQTNSILGSSSTGQ